MKVEAGHSAGLRSALHDGTDQVLAEARARVPSKGVILAEASPARMSGILDVAVAHSPPGKA